jgi:hypothetical protein
MAVITSAVVCFAPLIQSEQDAAAKRAMKDS